jgi:hypothetical protein
LRICFYLKNLWGLKDFELKASGDAHYPHHDIRVAFATAFGGGLLRVLDCLPRRSGQFCAQKSFERGTSRIATFLRPNRRASNEIAPGPRMMSTADITMNSKEAILESNRSSVTGGLNIRIIPTPPRQTHELAIGVRNPTNSATPAIAIEMAASVATRTV